MPPAPGDLEQRLAQLKEREGGAVTQPQVLDWFVQMALALQYLHSRRILHRDLKTANVFLTRRDIVKLGDFGVSRVLSATAELARTFVGTPYYLSPELLNNQPYGQPSDVWALGCIFYEVATLEHPYEAKTFPSLAFKIINEDVRPLASYPAARHMEPELQRLVELTPLQPSHDAPTLCHTPAPRAYACLRVPTPPYRWTSCYTPLLRPLTGGPHAAQGPHAARHARRGAQRGCRAAAHARLCARGRGCAPQG